jgi:transcriptional regulator with XRE-family HTH domain
MTFGELVKNLRISRKFTLRSFCAAVNVDPSNWSKIERGVSPAPKNPEVLSSWADFFDLVDDDRQQFMDLADLSRSEIPHDMASNEKVMAAMPAFFRAARGHRLSEEKLSELIEDVRMLHSPDKE